MEHVDQFLDLHNTKLIERAYKVLLGRAPDIAGMHHYLQMLRRGYGKLNVLADISTSKEAATVGTKVLGLSELIRAQRQSRIPFLGWFGRGVRLESQANRLEYEVGHLTEQLQRVENMTFLLSKQLNTMQHAGFVAKSENSTSTDCESISNKPASVQNPHQEKIPKAPTWTAKAANVRSSDTSTVHHQWIGVAVPNKSPLEQFGRYLG